MNNMLRKLHIKLQLLMQREEGASAIEYAIIAGLISLAVIAVATPLGAKVAAVFSSITEQLPGS